MKIAEYEKSVLVNETLKGGKNIELTETSASEQGLIAEVLANMLYKIVLIAIQFGIDFNEIADISLLQNGSQGK